MWTSEMFQYTYNDRIKLGKISKFMFMKYCKEGYFEVIPAYYNDNMMAISLDGKVVGFVTYELKRTEKNGYAWCELTAIEINPLYRGQHIATYVIWFLLSNLTVTGKPIRAIYGDAWYKAIYFWKKLGVDFGLSQKKLQEQYLNGLSAAFTLTLPRLIKALGG